MAAAERSSRSASFSSAEVHDDVLEWSDDLEAELRLLENTILQRGHDACAGADAAGAAVYYDEAVEKELQALEHSHSVLKE